MNIGIIKSNIKGGYCTGGLIGFNDGAEVSGCYNSGDIFGYDIVGGIIGYSFDAEVSGCYNIGSVKCHLRFAGGVTGCNSYGFVTGCYNTGSVGTTSSEGEMIGGVTGTNDSGTISSCYNTGEISGIYCTGGVAGRNMFTESQPAIIEYCYSVGNVILNGMRRDCAIGTIYGDNITVTSVYFLDTDALNFAYAGDMPLTDAQLRSQDSYVGFDFADTWTISDDSDYFYAELVGNEHKIDVASGSVVVLGSGGETVIGTSTSLNLTISNIDSLLGTYGGTVYIEYDSSKLTFEGVTLPEPPAGSAWQAEFMNENTPGVLEIWFMDDEYANPLTAGQSLTAKLSFTVKDTASDGDVASLRVKEFRLMQSDLTYKIAAGIAASIRITSDMFKLADGSRLIIDETAGYVYRVKALTSEADFLDNFVFSSIRVVMADGTTAIEDGKYVGTGCKVQFMRGGVAAASYEIVVAGDTTGDGRVMAADYIQIRQSAKNLYTLSGANFEAADIVGDDTIEAIDYAYVKLYVLGKYDLFKDC